MAPLNKILAVEAMNEYGVVITSSPQPISRLAKEVFSALVPFTNARHLLLPINSAHFLSNSRVTFFLDHTPLRMTSSRSFSSVSGFQIGQFGQSWSTAGFPPRMAGV